MKRRGLAALAVATLVTFIPSAGQAQGRYDPVATMAAQRAAMVPLVGTIPQK